MKIAVASALPTLDTCVETQFHRSKYILIIDLDTMEYKAMMNSLLVLSGPAAGKLFAQELLEENVEIVLASNCSSDILKFLGSAGIRIIVGVGGSVRRAVEQFREICSADTSIISFEEIEEIEELQD